LLTPVLITNPDNFKELEMNIWAQVKAGQDEILTYKVK
jgi:hypothetical protein